MIGIRPPKPATTIVQAAHATDLGSVAGSQYVTVNYDEYRLGGEVDADAGGTILAIPVFAEDDRGKRLQVGTRYRRLERVPAGTFSQLTEREQRRFATAPPRLTDDLGAIASLAAKGAYFPRTGNAPGMLDFFPSTSGDPRVGVAPGRGPIRGRSLFPWLERAGVRDLQWRERDGRRRLLWSASKGQLRNDVLRVLEMEELLLIGYLIDDPEPCSLDHGKDQPPEAITTVCNGWPACEAHSTGELRP